MAGAGLKTSSTAMAFTLAVIFAANIRHIGCPAALDEQFRRKQYS